MWLLINTGIKVINHVSKRDPWLWLADSNINSGSPYMRCIMVYVTSRNFRRFSKTPDSHLRSPNGRCLLLEVYNETVRASMCAYSCEHRHRKSQLRCSNEGENRLAKFSNSFLYPSQELVQISGMNHCRPLSNQWGQNMIYIRRSLLLNQMHFKTLCEAIGVLTLMKYNIDLNIFFLNVWIFFIFVKYIIKWLKVLRFSVMSLW